MNKDQRLLEEAYQSICESTRQPAYFGPPDKKEAFMKWLKKMKHEVHEDGSVSIDGDVWFENYTKASRLPFNFKTVTGDFGLHKSDIVTLEGCPKEVTGAFSCSNSKITSLKEAPELIGGGFYCAYNKLSTLEGAPEQILRSFDCSSNRLTSLKGAPKKVGYNFDCGSNPLASLEGAPEVVKGRFYSDQFFDEDYRKLVRDRRINIKLNKKLSKDFSEDALSALDDFS